VSRVGSAGAIVLFVLATPALAVDYVTGIKPLLKSRCFGCHGALQHEGGLRLDAISLIRAGGDSGALIAEKNSGASLLFQRVSANDPAERMPPEGSGVEPLSAEEVARVREWIDGGAIAPEEPVPPDPREHWAFKPVKRHAVPAGSAVHPIDAFVVSRLKEEGLSPGPAADRATLLRRLSFDLLGLPPTPAEVREFVADDQPDAYERLVDRLLASPHFGERWGKHWLDVARYADTDGYSGEQYRPWAWRWRDWVIDSFNADQPYDEFTIDQLAGDLLPEATLDERIATGFHRNALHSRETDADPEEFRVRKVVECVNVTGAAWLGLTVGCAQCHSHKFDPISHNEYFGLYAFFNSTDEVEIPAPLRGDAAAFAEASLTLAALPKPEAPKEGEPVPAPQTMAPVLQQRPELRVTHVQLRGDFLSPGEEVRPHTPAVLPALSSDSVATRLDLAEWLVSAEHPLTARVAVNRAWQHLFGRGLVRTENDFGTQGSPPSHPELLDWLATELQFNGWSRKQLIRTIVTSHTYRQSAALSDELTERDPENRLLARQNRIRHEAEILRDAALSSAGLLDTQIGGPSFRPPVPPDAGNVVEYRWKSEATPDRYRRGVYIVVQRNVQLPFLMTFDAPDGNTFCTRRERSNTPPQALTLLNDPFFFECAAALGRRVVMEAETDDERIALAFLSCASRGPADDERLEFQAFLRDQRRLLEERPELATALAAGAPAEQAIEVALWTSAARVLMNTDEFVCRE